jgi:hypothetical protein
LYVSVRRCFMRTVGLAAVLLAAAPLGAATFTDGFDRPDGELTEWYQAQPEARIEGGALVLEQVEDLEPHAWAGRQGTAVSFENLDSVSFTIDFAGYPPDVVGRHGGVLLCASSPTQRYDQGTSGYFIDWIDRVEAEYNDHGLRVHRMDLDSPHVQLAKGTDGQDPPSVWTIEFTETGFRLFGDGEPIQFAEQFDLTPGDTEITDTTYRSGFVGFWCYKNQGQLVHVDDVTITSGETPQTPEFKRGDANRDGTMNIADAVYVLQNIFAGGPAIRCMDAADANDDENVNIADAVYLLQNIFAGGAPLPAPGPEACGPDPTSHPGGQADLAACEYCPEACGTPPAACP